MWRSAPWPPAAGGRAPAQSGRCAAPSRVGRLAAALLRAGSERVAAVSPRLVDVTERASASSGRSPRRPVCGWRPWASGGSRRGRLRGRNGAAPPLGRDAEVGPLDERFFLYAEETDWQRRACTRLDFRALHRRRRRARGRRNQRRPAPAGGALPRRPGDLRTEVVRQSRLVGLPSRCVRRSDRESLELSGEAGPRPRAGLALRARPRRCAGLARCSRCLSVVHVVTTANFAGVERYVCDVARETATAAGTSWLSAATRDTCRRRCGDAALLAPRLHCLRRCARWPCAADVTFATRT